MLAKQRNEAIRHVIAYVFTIVMVFLAVTPFIYVVLTALKTKEQIYDPSQIIPTHITFDNFRHVLFQSNFVRYFMNSIFITLVTTLICMILSVMAAYGLTRYKIAGFDGIFEFRGRVDFLYCLSLRQCRRGQQRKAQCQNKQQTPDAFFHGVSSFV